MRHFLVLVIALVVLPWLCVATISTSMSWNPNDSVEFSSTYKSWKPTDSVELRRRINENQHCGAHSSGNRRSLATGNSTWNTLNGNPPLVIANGGSPGLFPDQTIYAYLFALNNSLISSTALLCDLQLTADLIAICRTGIDLDKSTNVNVTHPTLLRTRKVNGQEVTGFFAVDLNASQIYNSSNMILATQSNPTRSPFYDKMFSILDPNSVLIILNNTNGGSSWLNVEYPGFYSQFYNMTGYILSLLESLPYEYVSSPEVAFLKAVSEGAPNTTNLVLRFHGKNDIEPSTNVTYENLLSDLKTIATYAKGIMVPKDYVWPVDSETRYLGVETTLVKDAHDAGLAIYVSEFLTDQLTTIYNYSFDPIREYLQYMPSTGPIVDGFLTDFPSTASEALACYRTPSTTQTDKKTLIISHNGASGDYPGCTKLAYEAAVRDGANIIDCSVQITQDGVAICRESPNLLISTDASSSSFFSTRLSTVPELATVKGLYSFNMTWNEIQTNLKATISTPTATIFGSLFRNPANDGTQSILSFSEFLTYAKDLTDIEILVNIQNAYFLKTQLGLDVLNPVIKALSNANLINSSRVVVQSEDSAVLEYLKVITNSTLVYRVTSTNVTITASEIEQIKLLADRVTLPRGLIQRANYGYLLNSSGVVELFHNHNVPVYVHYLRNAFTDIAFDYEADPALELNTMVNFFKVDGIITDFPATASAFLSKNCVDYTMRFIIPGELSTILPPDIPPVASVGGTLNVTQNQDKNVFDVNTTPSPPGNTPSNTSFRTPVPYFLIILAILGSVFQSL